MRLARFALVSASVLAAACAADSSTAPKDGTSSDPRLSAVTAAPTAAVSGGSVATLLVSITSALPEPVSAGLCAQVVEAKPANVLTWTDVTAAVPCAAIALVVQPGGTTTLNAYADQAKVRTVAGSGATSVILRVKTQMSGASSTYQVQSNEVIWQLP
jgi:xanthine/uracil/vitamin C permease (AzgA family)